MMDHKVKKKWQGIFNTKHKCSICETTTATRKREYNAPQLKNKVMTLYHCDGCHKQLLPRRSNHY